MKHRLIFTLFAGLGLLVSLNASVAVTKANGPVLAHISIVQPVTIGEAFALAWELDAVQLDALYHAYDIGEDLGAYGMLDVTDGASVEDIELEYADFLISHLDDLGVDTPPAEYAAYLIY